MRVKCLILSILLSVSCMTFYGCSEDAGSAERVLGRICESLEMPSGSVYFCGAEEGQEGYLSPITASVLYGEEEWKEILPLLQDYAIYISRFAAPYEAAVFKCYSRSDADAVGALFLARAESISVLIKDTDYASLTGKVSIFSRGRYVAMVFCDDPERAEESIKKALN